MVQISESLQTSNRERLLVSWGPITPDKFVSPKTSVEHFENGVIDLRENGDQVKHDYEYE